jgi:type IV pilus assembly protein PilC
MVIMIKIIPAFMTIFDQIQGELPAFTKAFMGVYDIIMHHGGYVLGAIILAVIGGYMYARTAAGHERLSRLVLKIPLMGKIITQGFLTIFCNTMSTLLAAGVPVIEALNILMGMTNNDVIKRAVTSTKNYIVEGSNISISMAATNFFPNLMTKMAQIGEDSGSLPSVLDRTSQYYEKKVDASIKKMIGVLEPALIITVGLIVAIVVLALYLPIFNISDIKS